jgi:hypothetical protein
MAWAQGDWGEFLRQLQSERNVYRAADRCGMERSTVYRKRQRDPRFGEMMDAARDGRLVCNHCGEVVT